jgi:hypothetical protein
MIQPWAVLAYSLAYVGFLFAIAYWGDERARRRGRPCAKPVIYALSLAVHWTSWTFYGSVGLAAKAGYSFLPIYLGPILVLRSAGRCCAESSASPRPRISLRSRASSPPATARVRSWPRPSP